MTGRSQLETLAFCGGNLVLALLLFALVCMTRRQIPQVVSGDGGFKVSKLKFKKPLFSDLHRTQYRDKHPDKHVHWGEY